MFTKRMLQITLILAVMVACFAIPRSASAAGPCGSTYIVQPGDWLSKIANRCGVTLSALYAANPGVYYQNYIYPGQVVNIPGGLGPGNPGPGPAIPPQYYGPPYSQQYGTTNPSTSPLLPTYWFPHMTVTPHIGSNYYGSTAYVGTKLTFQTKVQNDGDVPLQIVANLTPPTDWDVNDNYNDCPTNLGAGNMCTFTWIFTPQVSEQIYLRVYVRGLYTDSDGNTQRITSSPAFGFNILTTGQVRSTSAVLPTYWFPHMTVTPHVGSSYYGSWAHVGTQLTFQTKVQNDGDVPLQVVANLTPPTDWDVNDNYNDCPTNLAVGSMCTFTWLFTPRVSGQVNVRVYVRGLYTDSYGNTQRITISPAFFFNAEP